jgi:MFS family permease
VDKRSWLNRNVLAIGLADCMADFNYEMVLGVLPLFLTTALGAPVYSVGLVEGVADGASAMVRVWSGWYSDRIGWRKRLAVGGYATTVAGLGAIGLISMWPLVVAARGVAWVGRGLRQPIRSSMLAGSVGQADFGKAFGFHEAMDTLGALLGPSVAFLLLATGHSFRTVFWVAIVPGVLAVAFFALLPRDPRLGAPPSAAPRASSLPTSFWRLLVPVGVFGVANFAPAFFTLRAAEMLQPELSRAAALTAAVLFYLGHQAVGALISFPGGWLADRLGRAPVLAFAYLSFAAACLVAAFGHGPLAVALLALPVGVQAPLVVATENALAAALVPERLGGTAFGVLAGVNGLGDLVSSVGAGALWTAAGAPAALGLAAVIALAAAGVLLASAPRLRSATHEGPPP